MPSSGSSRPGPGTASPRTTRSMPVAVTRDGSRAKARTPWPPRTSRGTSAAPTAPLAPVPGTDGHGGRGDEHLHDRPGYGRRAGGDHYPARVERYDLAIVGAGIVGLASARELLARRPGLPGALADAPP